jgi:hypothetical protein
MANHATDLEGYRDCADKLDSHIRAQFFVPLSLDSQEVGNHKVQSQNLPGKEVHRIPQEFCYPTTMYSSTSIQIVYRLLQKTE